LGKNDRYIHWYSSLGKVQLYCQQKTAVTLLKIYKILNTGEPLTLNFAGEQVEFDESGLQALQSDPLKRKLILIGKLN
jgi:hypothetical protein